MSTQKKFLFYISKIYSTPIIKPLVDELNKTDHSYKFYVSDKVKSNFPKEWNQSDILHSIKETKSYKPDYVLTPGNFVDFRIPGIKVQLFHGLGVEKSAHFKIRHFFDVFLTSGPYVTNRFNQLKEYHNNYFDVIETGWPKIDYILNYKDTDLKQELNIDSSKKVVLYAPTFSTGMESATELLDEIPKSITPETHWLLKFHELMPNEKIEKFEKKLPKNATVVSKKVDITALLHASDIMISDTSSVVYEFMALNKPVITYKTISRKDKSINIEQPNKLMDAINKLIENPTALNDKIDFQMKEINPYLDGSISSRVVQKLIQLNPSGFPKKKQTLESV